MKVLTIPATGIRANAYLNFAGNQKYQNHPSLVNKNISSTGAEQKDKSKLAIYSAGAGVSVLTLGAIGCGLYIKKSPAYVLKHLKETKITASLPDFLRKELAKGNKFNDFEHFIMSPDSKYLTGKGANSHVYNIPFMDDYVLKVIHKNSNLDLSKQYVGLFPQNVNLGQPVWQSPKDPYVFLLKKITGEPYSIKNWTDTIYNRVTGKAAQVTKEQTELYFSHISKVSEMNQSVFDNLAHQIKVLDSLQKFDGDNFAGFKIDSVNPNNLMVDFKKNTINVIDYFGKENDKHKNSYMDIVAIMSDFALLPEYRDLMKPEQQKKLVKILKTINQKALKAAEKEGLSTNKNDFMDFINEIGKYFFPPSIAKADGSGEYIRSYPPRAEELIHILES